MVMILFYCLYSIRENKAIYKRDVKKASIRSGFSALFYACELNIILWVHTHRIVQRHIFCYVFSRKYAQESYFFCCAFSAKNCGRKYASELTYVHKHIGYHGEKFTGRKEGRKNPPDTGICFCMGAKELRPIEAYFFKHPCSRSLTMSSYSPDAADSRRS